MTEAVRSLPWLRGRRALEVSPALAHAIRFGVASSAAIWIGKAPGLVENNSTWILITVLMVMQPTSGSSLLKGLLRAGGTAAAAFTAIGLFGLFAQDPPLLMAGFFGVQALAAYGYSGRRYQYAWFVWAFTTAIILGSAMVGEGAVETLAFQRASMVGIGILLVFVVESVLWPARAEPRLRQSLARRARDLGRTLRRAVTADPPDAAPAPESGALASQLALVDAVRTEIGVSRTRADALARLAMLLETLASRARVLAAPVEGPITPSAEGRALAEASTRLARRVEAALEEVAEALTASRVATRFSDDLEELLLALEAERDRRIRRVGWSAALEARVADLRDLVAVLRTLEATLASADEPAAAAPSRSLQRLQPDPLRMKIALRCGFAAIASFLVPLVWGWPMNPVVVPIAFMIAALTRGGAVRTLAVLSATIAFAWLVADLCIVYLTPHVGRAPLALLIPFSLAAAFAYLAAQRPQLAMLPSIGGVVALLSVFGGTSAPTDVYGPYNMVCYMAVALAVGWLFGRMMWPATSAGLFRQRVAVQLERCLEAVRAGRERGDAERGRRAAELIRACAEQAVQLGPLHAQAEHEPIERGLDQVRRAEILALVMDLMDAVVGDRPGAAEPVLERGGAPFGPLVEAHRRADRALLDSLQAAVDAMRGDAAVRDSELGVAQQAVEDRLEELRADRPEIPDLTDDERRRVIIELDANRRLAFRQRAIEEWLAD